MIAIFTASLGERRRDHTPLDLPVAVRGIASVM
jgi:hypothetical protein